MLFKSSQLCQNDKNCQLNKKKRKIRKRKATKLKRKDFELCFLFETSCEKKNLERQQSVDMICILSFHFETSITKK